MRNIKLLTIITAFLSVVLLLGFNSMQSTAIKGGLTEKQSGQQPDKIPFADFKVTFIELGSVRCIPCQKMQKVMESVEKKYGEQVNTIFYDVWTSEGKPYAEKYKINLTRIIHDFTL